MHDFPLFCWDVLINIYHKQYQPFHDRIIRAFVEGDWGVLKCFRGSAKTEYACLYELWKGKRLANQYQVYSSSNLPLTKEGVRKMGRFCKKVPYLLDAVQHPLSKGLKKMEIEFTNGSIIHGLPYTGQLRGYGNEEVRVTLWIGDDIYSKRKLLQPPEYIRIWRDDVEPAIEPNGQLFLVGTPFYEDDLFALCLTDALYDVRVVLPVLDDQGQSIWEQRLPLARLEKIRQRDPVTWAREYMVTPINPEGAKFKRAWLGWFQTLPEDGAGVRYCFVDAAASERDEADYAGILDVFHSQRRWYIYDAYAERGIDAIGQRLLDMRNDPLRRPPITLFYIEAPGTLGIAFRRDPTIQQLGGMVLYKTHVEGNKIERIGTLESWGKLGYLYVRTGACQPFLTEWLGFPHAKHLHCLDALQAGIEKFAPVTKQGKAVLRRTGPRSPMTAFR